VVRKWPYLSVLNGAGDKANLRIDNIALPMTHHPVAFRRLLMTAPALSRPVSHSFVLEHAAADPAEAHRHFTGRLSVETDPSDVHADLERGVDRIVVVDARSAQHFAECHVPGALNLPHRSITEATTASLSRDVCVVVYCWGPACNAATKAGARLSALGFRVKEMIGGLEYWRREGYSVEGTLASEAPLYG
jgi:rhodanese-related sulfurtransferase